MKIDKIYICVKCVKCNRIEQDADESGRGVTEYEDYEALYESAHPSALCSLTSASIVGELLIAYSNFALNMSFVEYDGRDREKKQVCA